MEFLLQNWWVLLFVAGYAFMMFRGGGCCGASSHGGHEKNKGYVPAGAMGNNEKYSENKIEMVLDPECGMYVNPDSAVKLQIDGATYYFCSETCRNEFILKQKDKISYTK